MQPLSRPREDALRGKTEPPLTSQLFLSLQLAEEMTQQGVDLLVLEGMGRAIQTNFHTKVKCESLKVAVLKNRWLAQHLGGDMFSVVFKYEVP